MADPARDTAVASALKRLRFDPVAEAVAVVGDAKQEGADARLLAVRAKVACELMQYLYPKRKSVEIVAPKSSPSAETLDRARQMVFGYSYEQTSTLPN